MAYFCGSFIFEVVVGVALSVFTFGGSLLAQAVNATEKASILFKLFLKEALSTATSGVVDIISFLKNLIANFVLACKKGWSGLKEFIENFIAKNKGEVDD